MEGDRQLGVWMTSALVVGTMIGSGIFMLPASLAPVGGNAIIAWIVSSAGALCIAFGLASLSRLGGDGIQANIERELGPTIGFLVAWAFWVSVWTSLAAIAIAGASALAWISPAISGPGAILAVASGSVILFTGVNALGVRAAGGVQLLTVAIKLLPLIAVTLLLIIRSTRTSPLEPLAPEPISFATVAGIVPLTFFALLGFESATALVGKVRNPSRILPLAIMGGTLFVAFIYLVSSTSVQLLLPAASAASSPAPFAEVIAIHWGDAIASIFALAIAVAAFGAVNGGVLMNGELGYSMALRRDLPGWMAKTTKGGTPVAAQISGSIMALLLILANGSRATASLFAFLLLLTTAASFVIYLAGAVAAWRLNLSTPARATLIGAVFFILYATYGTGAEAVIWCLMLLAAGLVIRAILHRLIRREALRTRRAVPAAPNG